MRLHLDPAAEVVDKTDMLRIWLTKPIYETLPFFYLIAGVGLLVTSLYLDYWFWPEICLAGGVACLILGLFILLKRRDFRSERKPDDE